MTRSRLGALLMFVLSFSVHAQNASIFENDTCVPPCWFGLTPGISTAADADAFFQSHNEMFEGDEPPQPHGTFDPASGYLQDGVYQFEIIPQANGAYKPGKDRVYIHNGIVDYIDLSIHQNIKLDKVLDSLGMPDRVYSLGRRAAVEITLIYSSLRMRINAVLESCRDSHRSSFWVYRVRYYSERAAQEGDYYIGYDQPLPRLTAPELELEAAPAIWSRWLSLEVPNNPCLSDGSLASPSLDHPHSVRQIDTLFEGNPCEAPCWFNLTPGISTEADVQQMLFDFKDIFSDYTISDETYMLDWADDTSYTGFGGPFVHMENNRVTSIRTSVNRTILLSHVLEIMGQPDEVYLTPSGDFTDAALHLMYIESNMVISLYAYTYTGCYASSIGSFWVVDRVFYGSSEFNELRNSEDVFQISDETWDSWFNRNEPIEGCSWLEQ